MVDLEDILLLMPIITLSALVIFFVAYVITFYVQTVDLKVKTNNYMNNYPNSDLFQYVKKQLIILISINSLFIATILIVFGYILTQIFIYHNYYWQYSKNFLIILVGLFFLFAFIYSTVLWINIESKINDPHVIHNFKESNANVGALIALPAVLLFLFFVLCYFCYFHPMKQSFYYNQGIGPRTQQNQVTQYETRDTTNNNNYDDDLSDDLLKLNVFSSNISHFPKYNFGSDDDDDNQKGFLSRIISIIKNLFQTDNDDDIPLTNVSI